MGAALANILHANWSKGLLHLWAEAGDALRQAAPPGTHPFAPGVPPAGLLATLAGMTPPTGAGQSSLVVRLPASGARPLPSAPLARELGLAALEEDAVAGATIDAFAVPTLSLDAGLVHSWLPNFVDGLSQRAELGANGEAGADARWLVGPSLEFFALLARFARHLLAQQRFVPLLVQRDGELCGAWEPWVSDPASADRLRRIVGAMPPAARCVVDDARHDAWAVCDSFLAGVVDAACRQRLISEDFADALTDRNPGADVHVAWLKGMLGEARTVPASAALRQDMTRRVRAWVSVLEERGPSSHWRLMLRLAEPVGLAPDAAPAPDDKAWSVSFHLQNVDQPTLVLDAPDIWLLTGESATIMGRRIDRPQDLLLGELGRASRFYKVLEEALEDSKPESLELSTRDAYEFLREIRPILLEQGFAVEAPEWWDSPAARVGAKLKLESGEADPFAPAAGGLTNAAKVQLGLAALVGYKWEIAVGDTTLSLH